MKIAYILFNLLITFLVMFFGEGDTTDKEHELNKEKGRTFPSWMYLNHDRKKHVIEKSIDVGTLGVGATTSQTRNELLDNLIHQDKNKITITMGTGGFFSIYDLYEIASLEKKLKDTNKEIDEIFGGSGGSLAVILWSLGYKDEKYIDMMCNVPQNKTDNFLSVKNNFSYIAAAKMLPFTTDISIVDGNGDIQKIPGEIFVDFMGGYFNDVFDLCDMYKTGGSLDNNGGMFSEHIIQKIVTELIKKYPEEFYKKTNILFDSSLRVIAYKLTYQNIFDRTGIDVGTLVAAKNKGGSYKTVKFNKDNDIPILDAVMGSSNVGKSLRLSLGGKDIYIKDPYFTTKTTAEKEIHDMVKNGNYHLALITLNRFRFNPKDLAVRLGLSKNTSELWHADAVLAPDFKEINSLQPVYIAEIDSAIADFMGADFPTRK